ncbi:MAG: DUF2911 domain-containing protein [Acidobacteria bacterium]|nr:DUF2911 domain-containing protein [Acidobacteriota bacterium]MBV9624617.1 DUF2911 domain-containing protein [Acidobacteriota bacterium]
MLKRIAWIILVSLTVCIISSAQQDKSKRPSPSAQAQCKFPDGKTITVDYSSPRMKNRKIFGDLVPYGEVWRTGANEATTFVTNTNLTAEGKDVPAGSYTIFTIPAQDKWTLIINKHTGEWGIPYKYESEEQARVPMQASSAPSPVENFTIRFDQSGGACNMQMSWENTQAAVKFSEKR